MNKRIWKVFTPSSELAEPRKKKFTLDQDGGLVVSFTEVLNSEGFRRQLNAARDHAMRVKKVSRERIRELADSEP